MTQAVAENIWLQHFPLSLLGGHQGRVVTLIRLSSGKLIIHSTAPFTGSDVAAIEALGQPVWLVDAMLRHETFAREGRAAFPSVDYLVPEGFAALAKVETKPLLPAPPEWAPEVRVLRIEGMPKAEEHVFLHAPSRTLIVADLVFNFAPSSGWTSFFRKALVGVKEEPDSARLYPLLIKDRAAYERSIRELLSWDFDRIIVGHKDPVERDGKARLRRALGAKGMLPR
jgi:hypothetical protein